MRVIIATCAGLVALSTISAQATPLPQAKPFQQNSLSPLSCQRQTDAGTDIGAPAGRIIGAIGIGVIASRRCTGIYLAKTWPTKLIPSPPLASQIVILKISVDHRASSRYRIVSDRTPSELAEPLGVRSIDSRSSTISPPGTRGADRS